METLNQISTENYLENYESIINTIQLYIDGSREGKSELMRPGFHPDATIIGYFGGGLIFKPIEKLYDLINNNGPAPKIEPQIISIEILGTIAVARLDVKHWSGNVLGVDSNMSDVFNLVKGEEGWKITQKMFHLNDK